VTIKAHSLLPFIGTGWTVVSVVSQSGSPGFESDSDHQAPVFQKVDSAIQWINLYPLDSAIGSPNIYPLDSDLSGG